MVGHGCSRGAAAVPALLALCLLCLAGAPAAAAPIVRAAVPGNAATSMAILVRASVPRLRSRRPCFLREPCSRCLAQMLPACTQGRS